MIERDRVVNAAMHFCDATRGGDLSFMLRIIKTAIVHELFDATLALKKVTRIEDAAQEILKLHWPAVRNMEENAARQREVERIVNIIRREAAREASTTPIP